MFRINHAIEAEVILVNYIKRFPIGKNILLLALVFFLLPYSALALTDACEAGMQISINDEPVYTNGTYTVYGSELRKRRTIHRGHSKTAFSRRYHNRFIVSVKLSHADTLP